MYTFSVVSPNTSWWSLSSSHTNIVSVLEVCHFPSFYTLPPKLCIEHSWLEKRLSTPQCTLYIPCIYSPFRSHSAQLPFAQENLFWLPRASQFRSLSFFLYKFRSICLIWINHHLCDYFIDAWLLHCRKFYESRSYCLPLDIHLGTFTGT